MGFDAPWIRVRPSKSAGRRARRIAARLAELGNVHGESRAGWRSLPGSNDVEPRPLTVTPRGYPLLLQTGESFHGEQLHDRQHPHDFWMEVGALYERADHEAVRRAGVRRSVGRARAWAGCVHAPAVGNGHSDCADRSSLAGRHAHFVRRRDRRPLRPQVGGWRVRRSMDASPMRTAGTSIRSPRLVLWPRHCESDDELESHRRLRIHSQSRPDVSDGGRAPSHRVGALRQADRDGRRVVERGDMGREFVSRSPGAVAEFAGGNGCHPRRLEHRIRTHGVRAEIAEDLAVAGPSGNFSPATIFNVGSLSVGYIRELTQWFGVSVGLGGMGTMNVVPSTLKPSYGSRKRRPPACSFLRLRASRERAMNSGMGDMKMN